MLDVGVVMESDASLEICPHHQGRMPFSGWDASSSKVLAQSLAIRYQPLTLASYAIKHLRANWFADKNLCADEEVVYTWNVYRSLK